MDRKGWPWRKKSSEKIMSAADNNDSPPVYSNIQDKVQDSSGLKGDQTQTTSEVTQLLQAEAKVKILNEQLSAAWLDAASKGDLVKQHAHVAEEAVTGWEKAEAEAAALKQKLDTALQQKSAMEDRVSHLDGALKECMWQLRQVREEQEQKIHDTIVKKTREWEKFRLELEVKLADVTHQLLEAEAENSVMSRSLQEHARSILEATEAKSRVEAEIKVLHVGFEAMEKENAKLNYEVHVLTKELEIRNKEGEYNKREREAANKQHLENVKKVAKLEAECQRLRLLVRKRLPGPASLAQMKLEVEALEKESGEGRRRSPCRRNPIPMSREVAYDITVNGNVPGETEMLSGHLFAMEEETKLLKQELEQRNSELQAARLMCAQTASKLSNVEEQLTTLSQTHALPKTSCMVLDGKIERSLTSAPEDPKDEVGCAESWASALISQLAQFKKAGLVGEKMESANFNLMNDFAEMEKLASLTSENSATLSIETEKTLEMVSGNVDNYHEKIKSENGEHLEAMLTTMEHEIVSSQCEELKIELAYTKEKLDALQAKQAARESNIANLQQCLAKIFVAETDKMKLKKVIEEAKSAMEAFKGQEAQQSNDLDVSFCSSCLETVSCEGSHEGSCAHILSPNGFSVQSHSKDDAMASSTTKSKVQGTGPELVVAVRKVLGLAEGLAQSDFSQSSPCPMHEKNYVSNVVLKNGHTDLGKQWRSFEFDACIRSLVTLSNGLLQGQVEIIDFIEEVESTLDWLVGNTILGSDNSPARTSKRRQFNLSKELTSASNSEVESAVSSFVPVVRTSDIENEDSTESHASALDKIPALDDSHQQPEISSQDERTSKIIMKKEMLEKKLEVEMKKIAWLEIILANLKSEKDELELKHKLASENLEETKRQLQESENNVTDLQSQLSVALEEKQSVKLNLENLLSEKEALESRVNDTKASLKKLEEKVAAMDIELQEERNCRKDVEMKFQELQQQQLLLGGGSQSTAGKVNDVASVGQSENEESRLKKEQEIAAAAEKLAECQQTILVLGKQLKALGASKDPVDASFRPPLDTISSNQVEPSSRRLPISCNRLQCTDETGDASHYSSTNFSRATPAGIVWPMNESNRRQEHESSMGPRHSYTSGASDTGGYGGMLQGRQVPPEMYRANGSLSSLHGTYSEGSRFLPSPPVEAVSSPARSPARFLSLKNRISGGNNASKHINTGETELYSEKHGTGFSRFFSRTRSGH